LREQEYSDGIDQRTRTTVTFRSALHFAHEQAKFDTSLALELAQYCPTLAAPRAAPGRQYPTSAILLPTSASALPPPLPPTQEEYEEWDGLSDTASDSHCASVHIRNPPIPGPAMVSADALQSHVNEFARENGFGVVRRNGSGSRMRKTRYVFHAIATASLVHQGVQVSAKGGRASAGASGRSSPRPSNRTATCGHCGRLPTLSTVNTTTTVA